MSSTREMHYRQRPPRVLGYRPPTGFAILGDDTVTSTAMVRRFCAASGRFVADEVAIVIDDLAGVITELEDARLIVFNAGPEYYRFEVHEAHSGSRLVFIHGFDEHAGSAAQFATGWEAYLERLDAHLNGGFLSEEDAHEKSANRSAFYAERFGNAR
jgi:hypothetical protein